MQIASQRMAERQQGLTDGEIGVAGGTARAYGEEVSTEPGEEEVYLSDPGSSSGSTRDLRELRMVYVRVLLHRVLLRRVLWYYTPIQGLVPYVGLGTIADLGL